jgi:hypothetical protein
MTPQVYDYFMPALIDISGRQYGLLTVVERAGTRATAASPSKEPLWRCRCVCGREIVERRSHLASGRRRYCSWLNHKAERQAAHKRGIEEHYRRPRQRPAWLQELFDKQVAATAGLICEMVKEKCP